MIKPMKILGNKIFLGKYTKTNRVREHEINVKLFLMLDDNTYLEYTSNEYGIQ